MCAWSGGGNALYFGLKVFEMVLHCGDAAVTIILLFSLALLSSVAASPGCGSSIPHGPAVARRLNARQQRLRKNQGLDPN